MTMVNTGGGGYGAQREKGYGSKLKTLIMTLVGGGAGGAAGGAAAGGASGGAAAGGAAASGSSGGAASASAAPKGAVNYSKSSPSPSRGQSGPRWTPLARGNADSDRRYNQRYGQGRVSGGPVHDDGPNPDRPKKGLHPADQTKIWAEPGEYVVRRPAVDLAGHDVMERINSGQFDPMLLRRALGLPEQGDQEQGGTHQGGPQGKYGGGMVQQDAGMIQRGQGIQSMGNRVEQPRRLTPPESQPQTQGKKEKKKGPIGLVQGGMVPNQQRSQGQVARDIYGAARGTGYTTESIGHRSLQDTGPLGLIGRAGLHGVKNYTNYLEAIAPMAAGSLAGTQEYANAQNFDQFINPLQQFGVGAGQIAQGAQQGLTQAQNALSSQGLGRSAAMSSLANQAALGAASGQADLFSGLYQQGQSDRYNATQNNYAMLQDVVSMALGNAPLSERMLRYSTYGRPKNDGRPTENDLVKESLAGWL